MPRLSDSMEEGTILKWLKSDGDEVSEGDELAEIETDKATMTYEADAAGVLEIVADEGQTLAIAGLLEDDYKATNVGDLPFLAKVFGRRNAARNETELIILVTPELVHPMEPEEVPPLPGFDVTEPTNAEFFLCGDLEGYPTRDYRSTVWPRLKKRYGGPAMTSGPFGHGQ